jgi:hypothetical protein
MLKLTLTLISLLLLLAPSLTSPISQAQADTKESDAVDKITRGNFPKMEENEEEQTNLAQQFIAFLTDIFTGDVLFQIPKEKDRMYVQAKQSGSAYTPEETKPKAEGKQKFINSLGPAGTYGAGLPVEAVDDDHVSGYEFSYECSQFPDVHPITPTADKKCGE